MRFIEKRQTGRLNHCPWKCYRFFYIMPVS